MNNILITNPPGKYFVRARGDNWPSTNHSANVTYTSFPYLLATTAAQLEKVGHQVCLIDCVAENIERDKFIEQVYSFNPTIVVMLTSTPSYYYDVDTRQQIGKNIPVVAVGVHASATPQRHLEDKFDYVARGEFEHTITDLINHLGNYNRIKEIKGVCFKQDDNLHISDFSEPTANLDDLPFPAYHLLKMDLYSEPFAKGKNIMMLTSRGCPYNCDYCCVPYFYGKPIYRKRTPKLVVDEIEYLIGKYNIDEIYFDDSSITIDKNHLLSIASEIKNRNLNISWSCMGNVHITDDTLEKLAESGCRGLKIGIETGSDEVQEKISKGITTSKTGHVVKTCKKLGMKVHGTYMIGLPGESAEKARQTIEFMLKLDTDAVQIAIATPFPGTKFYKDTKKNDWLITEDWSLFDGNHAVLSYPDFNSTEIENIFKEATRKWERHVVFTKPTTILHHLHGLYKRKGINGVVKGLIYGMKTILRRNV